MASTILFVVMTVIAVILLLLVGIFATIGASRAINSGQYNASDAVRSAHQYLTIAAVIGWAGFAVLIVILIVSAVAGGFSRAEVKDALLYKGRPTEADLLTAYSGQKNLESGQTVQTIVIIVLFLIVAATLGAGILSVIAAIQLAGATQDGDIQFAYVMAIAASVAGVGGTAILIIAILTYFGVKSARDKQVNDLKNFQTRAEQQLGVDPNPKTVIPSHVSSVSTTSTSTSTSDLPLDAELRVSSE